VQPEEEADPEANHNPQPRENQVKLGSVRVHDFKFRLNAPTLAERSCGVLIDKKSGAIDLSNSWRDSIPGFGIFGWAKAALAGAGLPRTIFLRAGGPFLTGVTC